MGEPGALLSDDEARSARLAVRSTLECAVLAGLVGAAGLAGVAAICTSVLPRSEGLVGVIAVPLALLAAGTTAMLWGAVGAGAAWRHDGPRAARGLLVITAGATLAGLPALAWGGHVAWAAWVAEPQSVAAGVTFSTATPWPTQPTATPWPTPTTATYRYVPTTYFPTYYPTTPTNPVVWSVPAAAIPGTHWLPLVLTGVVLAIPWVVAAAAGLAWLIQRRALGLLVATLEDQAREPRRRFQRMIAVGVLSSAGALWWCLTGPPDPGRSWTLGDAIRALDEPDLVRHGVNRIEQYPGDVVPALTARLARGPAWGPRLALWTGTWLRSARFAVHGLANTSVRVNDPRDAGVWEALGRLGPRAAAAAEPLFRWVESGGDQTAEAAVAIGGLGRHMIPALVQHMERCPDDRTFAARVLRVYLGNERAATSDEALRDLCDTRQPASLRRLVASALPRHPNTGIEALLILMEDLDPSVAAAATGAMRLWLPAHDGWPRDGLLLTRVTHQIERVLRRGAATARRAGVRMLLCEAAGESPAAAALAELWSAHDYLWPAELDLPPMTAAHLPALVAVWTVADAHVRDRMLPLLREATGRSPTAIEALVESLVASAGAARDALLAGLNAAAARQAEAGAPPPAGR